MESVSALMDGELDADEAAREIARFKQDEARRNSWNTYHAIGDALRGERSRAGLSAEFSKHLSERLALEPTVVAPRLRAHKPLQTYLLAAAASVAAIAVVGWMSVTMLTPDEVPTTLAQKPAAKPPLLALQSPPAPVAPALALAPEHVHEYLLAHQGISPTTAIQGVTPYIRTVSNMGDEPGLR